jgi:hypothetical protein
MRWRRGLVGFSFIEGSCLEVAALEPLDAAPVRHLQIATAVDAIHPASPPPWLQVAVSMK